jgi:hypothetical protein
VAKLYEDAGLANWHLRKILAAGLCRVQYRCMAGRKKMSPDSSRRSIAKAEAMRKHINSFCGIFKRKPGEKPFAEEWAEYKREEKELEERKFQRLAALGKK